MPKAKRIIIGLDPGTSTSFAAFDLNGNFLGAETIRNPGKEGIIEEILKHGIPIVVATDVSTPPEFVAQVASNFSARLFVPERDMLQRDKEDLTRSMREEKEISSMHERDAAGAALNFIKHYKNKMAWLDRNISEKGLVELGDEIKTYVLQGVPLDSVIDYLTVKEKAEKEVEKGAVSEKESKRRREELEYLNDLMKSNAQLRSFLSVISSENRMLKDRLKALEHEFHAGISEDKVLKGKDLQIKRLQALLDRQSNEMSRLEQSLKMLKKNVDTGEKEKRSKRELEKDELEKIVDLYKEERE